jgi:hypothetical protein
VTTCWKVYREGDTFKIPLIIKDLWQYLERKKEGRLLRKAVEKGVVNIARYYHYGTIHVGRQDDNIYNICKGLDITKAINYKLKGLMIPLRLTRVQGSMRKG